MSLFWPSGLFWQRELCFREGAFWESEEGNLVWVFQDLGRGLWVKHTRCAGIKTITSVFCCSQLFGVWTKSCKTGNAWSFEHGRYVHILKHSRFIKRCLDLALCQQPISCVSSLLVYLVLFYVADGICLSENSYHLLRGCLVGQLLFPLFEISQQWHSSANSRNAHVGAYKHRGQPQTHSFTNIHRSISSMNRSFSLGLLLRPDPLCWICVVCGVPQSCCVHCPRLDGSPGAHDVLSLSNLSAYSHSWVFSVPHPELGPFV